MLLLLKFLIPREAKRYIWETAKSLLYSLHVSFFFKPFDTYGHSLGSYRNQEHTRCIFGLQSWACKGRHLSILYTQILLYHLHHNHKVSSSGNHSNHSCIWIEQKEEVKIYLSQIILIYYSRTYKNHLTQLKTKSFFF